MKKKIIGFIVCLLLITATGFSTIGIEEDYEVELNEKHISSFLEDSPPITGLFEWPMFRHDPYHTGYSPSVAPDNDDVLWSKHIGGLRSYSSPAVVDGYVYASALFTTGETLYCFDAFTGEEIWTYVSNDEFWAGPIIDGDRLYILGDCYNLYCLDAYSGGTIWTFPVYGGNCPAVVNNKVYVGNYGGGVYCLNATTGTVLWTFDITTDYQGCSPAVANGKVYIGSGPYNEPGTFYCLDADTGEEIWSYLTTGPGIWSSPCIFNNNVYFATDHLYCLNATTGEEVWTVSGITTTSSPAVAYGNVYIGNNDGKVYCFNATTAELVSFSQQLGQKSIWSSPAVADNKVYIASHDPGNMVCLDAYTGEMIWNYSMSPTHVYASPSIAYGNVYIGSGTTGDLIVFGTPNEPPDTPNNPDPEDGATDVDINADLSWNCSDPDGDNLTYDVYFEANDPTPDVLVSDNQSETTYDPGEMEYDTHYYWKIVAWDPYQYTEGPVWDFTTGSDPNNPPYVPSDPDPENDSTNVDIDSDLSWVGGDPDDDSVVYDVYFEANDETPDNKLADDISDTTFDPGTMEYETVYYWRIIAKDNHGASIWGPVWHFTTDLAPAPDLDCDGNLNWSNVKPGKTVEGSFTVINIGDPGTMLDWEIAEYPRWGTWSFLPLTGEDLKPEDEPVTVQVVVEAPDEKNSDFDGEVKIVNKENPTDFCTIDASLTTPKNRAFNFYVEILMWFFERFPNTFPILRYILGL